MLLLPPCISLLPKNSSYTHVQRNHSHNWTLNIAVARYWSEPKWPWSHQSYGQCLVYRCAIMHNTFDRWRSVLEETKFYRSFTWWSDLHLTSLSVSQTSISPLLLVCQKKHMHRDYQVRFQCLWVLKKVPHDIVQTTNISYFQHYTRTYEYILVL